MEEFQGSSWATSALVIHLRDHRERPGQKLGATRNFSPAGPESSKWNGDERPWSPFSSPDARCAMRDARFAVSGYAGAVGPRTRTRGGGPTPRAAVARSAVSGSPRRLQRPRGPPRRQRRPTRGPGRAPRHGLGHGAPPTGPCPPLSRSAPGPAPEGAQWQGPPPRPPPAPDRVRTAHRAAPPAAPWPGSPGAPGASGRPPMPVSAASKSRTPASRPAGTLAGARSPTPCRCRAGADPTAFPTRVTRSATCSGRAQPMVSASEISRAGVAQPGCELDDPVGGRRPSNGQQNATEIAARAVTPTRAASATNVSTHGSHASSPAPRLAPLWRRCPRAPPSPSGSRSPAPGADRCGWAPTRTNQGGHRRGPGGQEVGVGQLADAIWGGRRT
jgi:hypothetical protein